MRRVDLGAAVAAGLAVVLPLYQIFTLPEICESPNLTPGESAALLAALASYLSVPVLITPQLTTACTRPPSAHLSLTLHPATWLV
jgi:hypothetical protein